MLKEIRDIETEELQGYMLDDMSVPIAEGNRHYQEVLNLINGYTDEEGNYHEPITPEPAYTQEERQAYLANKMKQDYMNAIDSLIQAKIDEYNEANMVAFKNIDACAKYTAVPSYAHYQFCVDVIQWQTSVWETARAIMADVVAGNITPPSLDDFLAELPVFGA